jgi:hypothetical protein
MPQGTRSAVAGRLALCNIFYPDEADRDWAIATWHALTLNGREQEDGGAH